MKYILLTGANSYIGKSIKQHLSHFPDQYQVDEISVRDEAWKADKWGRYDALVHLAGIAHVSKKDEDRSAYMKVNRDLAYEVAQKAKSDGVKQFIFMSSIIIYGDDLPAGQIMIIDEKKQPRPTNTYSKSKWEAEGLIHSLSDEIFKTLMIRTPMVYGPNSKGNFKLLVSAAEKMPVFPNLNNPRSTIYVENLARYIQYYLDNGTSGVAFPQDDEAHSTADFVKGIRQVLHKRTYLTKAFNPFIRLLGKNIPFINKVFGTKMVTAKKDRIDLIPFEDAINRSVINE